MSPPIREKERAAILASLGAGVVPAIGLHHVQVGRKAEVSAMLQDLGRVGDGGAAVRFVVGRFGAGKSFFLNLVQSVALERKFVVVRGDVTVDRRFSGGNGVARALYAELMKNLATRSRPEGGALGSLVERFVSDVAHEVKTAGGDDAAVASRVHEVLAPLRERVGGYDFATVLAAYYRGFAEDRPELKEAAVRWLRAEYGTKTEARRDLGVRQIIDDDSFHDFLKLLAAFVRIAGYQGLLVCVDELVVLSHRLNNKTARDRNYEALLRIVNDCLQGAVEGLGYVFAATDECMQDRRRGLYSYEALATRLAPNRFAQDGLLDLSGPVLRLESLTPEDCFVLLHNVRRVFARGADEERLFPEEAIVAYLESCQQRMGAAYFQTPRETIKDFVGLLAVLEQNPGAEWRSLVGAIETKAPPERDPAETAAETAPESAVDAAAASDEEPSAPPPESPASGNPDADLHEFKL
jgi:hypothetical protein